MPKQNKELTTFITGTITTPSAEDAKPEAATYSKNLEPLDEQGKLKGIKRDLKVKPLNEGFSLVAYQVPSQGIFVTGDTDVTYTENDETTTTLEPEADATTTYYDETHTTEQITLNKDVDADQAAEDGRTYTEVYSLKSGDNIKVYNIGELLGEATYTKTAITGQIGTISPAIEDPITAEGTHSSDPVDTPINLAVDQFYKFTAGQTITVTGAATGALDSGDYTFDEATQLVTILDDAPDDVYTVAYTQTPIEEDAPYADDLFNWDGTTERRKTSLKVRILNSGINNGFLTNGPTVSDIAVETPEDSLKGRVIQVTSGTYDGAWAVIKSNKVKIVTLITNQGQSDEAVDPDNVDIGWYWEIEHTPLQYDAVFNHETFNTPSSALWENDATFTIQGGNNETWELLRASLEEHESVREANLLTSEEDDPSDFGAEESATEDEDNDISKTVSDLVKDLTYDQADESNDFEDNTTGWADSDTVLTLDDTVFHAGLKSMKVLQDGVTDAYVTKTISTTVNIWYNISFWIYKTDISSINAQYRLGTTSGGSEIIAATNALSNGSEWTKINIYVKGTGSDMFLSINPGATGDDHYCFVDDYATTHSDIAYLEVLLDIPAGSELIDISRVYIEEAGQTDIDFNPNNTTGYYFTEYTANDVDYHAVRFFTSFGIPDNNTNPTAELKVLYDQDSVSKDNLQYNNIQITFEDSVSEIEFEIQRINSGVTVSSLDANTHMRIDDVTEYFALDANQMIMFNEKDIQNIIFYSITEEDTEVPTATYDDATNEWSGTVKTFRMKILHDLYGDPSVDSFWTDDDGNVIYNDIPTEPEGVTLQKSNAAIFLGTGNTDKSTSKWYGKLFHSQFGKTIEGYVLDDAECAPIDDKSAVFNLDYTQQAYTNSLGFKTPFIVGITESTRKAHAVCTGSSVTTVNSAYGVGAGSAYGNQLEMNGDGAGWGYKAGAIAPSVYLTESMFTRHSDGGHIGDSSNETGDWIFNDGTATGCVWPPTGEHGSTTEYQNILQISKTDWLNQSYEDGYVAAVEDLADESGVYWVSDRSDNSKVTAYHLKMIRSDNGVVRTDPTTWDFKDGQTGTKEFTLKYGHDISSGSGTSAFAEPGGKEQRWQAKHYLGEYNTEQDGFLSYAPPAGTYISDIMEVHNWDKYKPYDTGANGLLDSTNDNKVFGFNTTKLYIQLSKNDGTGFGFGENWLYCVDLGGMNDGEGPRMNDTILFAKPITPPAMKMKTKSPGYGGDKLYYSREMVWAKDWRHLSWVGRTGSYGGYATSYLWRNCDELGFMTNGHHVTKESKNKKLFNRMRARTHSSRRMHQPGGYIIGSVTGNAAVETTPLSRDGAWPEYYLNARVSGSIDDINGQYSQSSNSSYSNRLNFASGNSFSQNDKHGSFPPKESEKAQASNKRRIHSKNSNMELGRPYGWLDYSIKPLRKGLVFTNNQDDFLSEEIGVICYINGKLITDRMRYNRTTRKRRKWRHRKKRSYLQQRDTVTPRQFKNWAMVTGNPWNLGVYQRCVPKDSSYITAKRNYKRTSSTYYNQTSDTYSTSYSWDTYSSSTSRRKSSDSNLYEFRQGAYAGLNFDPADGFDNQYNSGANMGGSIQSAKLRHQIYMFKDGTTGTTQDGFENLVKLPQNSISINNVNSHICNSGTSDLNNKLIFSYKGGDSNHSYIGTWNYVKATKAHVGNSSSSTAPVTLPGAGLSPNTMGENPLVLNNYGNALLVQRLRSPLKRNQLLPDTDVWDSAESNASNVIPFDLTPRSGSYQIGRIFLDDYGSYSDSTVKWANEADDTYGVKITNSGHHTFSGNPDSETTDIDNFNDFTTIYEGSMLSYGIKLKPIEVTVDSTDDDNSDMQEDAMEAGYDESAEGVNAWHQAQNFPRNKQYYYKVSFVYDGFQESPMNSYYFTVKTGDKSYANMLMDIKLAQPPMRVNAIAIYRKNNIEDYYRFVKEVQLDGNWASKDNQYIRIEIDDGILSGSYESINGVAETLRDTSVNYKISCTGGGVLFAANCWHPKIQNATNYIFKSQPGSFSIFDWTRDFLTLPSVPTSMVWFQGKLYVFDLNNTYRINAEMMAIEDTAEGTGCISNDSYIVTDAGLFFCDYSNMYMHTGTQAAALGSNILRSSLLDDEGTPNHAWQNIKHNRNPVVSYDPKIQTVRFMFEDIITEETDDAEAVTFTGSWNYNIPQQRFDLVEYPTPQSTVSGARSEAFLSDGINLIQLDAIQDKRKKWTYYTKTFNMGISTIDKRFHNVKIVHLDATLKDDGTYDLSKLGTVEIWIDNHFESLEAVAKKITTKPGQNTTKYFTTTYKLASNKAKGKTIQLRIKDSDTEVESIGIVYTSKRVK